MRSLRSKIPAFDATSLRVLEDLCESTWNIVQARHPFRDRDQDNELRRQLRLKVFILAENSGLDDLDALQRSALEAFSQRLNY
jgi:hypothetical protein